MKKIIIISLMAAMAATMTGQTYVESAFESLKKSGFVRSRRTSQNSDHGQLTGSLEIYEFTTNSNDDRLVIEDLIEAFESDSEDAYNYVSHKAGDTQQRYAIYYDPENSETIGRDKDDNYVMLSVMDSDDDTNTYRYCYAMEWRSTDDGNLTGRVMKTYAPKPNKSHKTFVWHQGDRKLGSIDFMQDDGKNYTLDLDSVAQASGLSRLLGDSIMVSIKALGLDSLGNVLDEALSGLENLGDLEGLQDLKDRIIVLSDDDNDEPADDVEWLTSFNHYRNAFKRAAAKQSSTMASYATSILKLCKNAKKVHLTDGELNLCRKSIKEMQKMTKDTFVKGLLDEAIANLR